MKVLVALTIFLSVAYAQFTPETACQGKSNGYLAPASDKTQFYHCDNCIGVLKCCPAGLVFNETQQTCVWPKATCGGNCGTVAPTAVPPPTTTPSATTTTTPAPTTTTTTTTTPAPTTTTTTTTTPAPTTTTTTTTTPAPTTTTTTTTTPTPSPSTSSGPPPVVTPPPGECECDCSLGQYQPDPNDEGKYIVCDNCRKITMCCPADLIWNDKIKACAWKNYGCNTCT